MLFPAWLARTVHLPALSKLMVAPFVPPAVHTVGVIKTVAPAWDRIYTYAWFVTFAIAFVLYGLMMITSQSVQEDLQDN